MKPFDANIAFRPPADAVRRLAVRSAGATVLSSGLGLIVQMVSTVALARLLTPGDFGVVAMVTTFSLLLVNFGGNGFTEAVIQWEEVTYALASNLFWINLGAGILLTFGFAAAGSLLAWFFKDPRVTHIAIGMSLTILITSTSVLHLALLKRAMRFTATSTNEIISRALSLPVAILLAWAGWGYWALVAGTVAQPLFQAIGAWYMCPWIPGLPRRVPGTASVMRFAMHVYGRFTVNYSARNLDNLLVGWGFQAQALGFYKKAYDLFALPAGQLVTPLANVAQAALSRLNRDLIQYKRFVLRTLAVTAFVGMGLGADLTLVGKDLIRLLLGPRWEPAGRIFTFFGPGIGIMFIYYTHGWIHISLGRPDRWFRWEIVELASTALLFVFALPWGPVGVAVAWTASFWVLTVPAFWYAGKPINLKVATVLSAVWKYILASLLAGFACVGCIRNIWLLVPAANVEEACVRIVMVTLLFGTFYLGAVILLHRGFYPLYLVADIFREMIPWGRFSRPAAADAGIGSTDTSGPPKGTRPSIVAVGVDRPDHADCGQGNVAERSALKPLVSILIPAYNAQNWIAETLRSALAQTWQRKEIIVVDDGSTDQTLAIAQGFEHLGVRVVTQENQGAAAARNKASSLSQGDYIQWLDADDLLAPDKIALQIKALGQGVSRRTLLSSAWGKFIYRSSRAAFTPTTLWCDLSPVEWLLRKMGQNLYMAVHSWLVSRELTEAAGPWDPSLTVDDDGEYFCRVLAASDGVRFVPEARVYYRASGSNTVRHIGRSGRKLEAQFRSIQLHIGCLRSLEDSQKVRAACVRCLQDWLIYFYPERVDIVKQMEGVAREMGGQLAVPRLSWRYSWIKAAFGWNMAKRAQLSLRSIRWSLERFWDKALFRLENRRLAGNKQSLRLGKARHYVAKSDSSVMGRETVSYNFYLKCRALIQSKQVSDSTTSGWLSKWFKPRQRQSTTARSEGKTRLPK